MNVMKKIVVLGASTTLVALSGAGMAEAATAHAAPPAPVVAQPIGAAEDAQVIGGSAAVGAGIGALMGGAMGGLAGLPFYFIGAIPGAIIGAGVGAAVGAGFGALAGWSNVQCANQGGRWVRVPTWDGVQSVCSTPANPVYPNPYYPYPYY